MKKKTLVRYAPLFVLAITLSLTTGSAYAAKTVYITHCAYDWGNQEFYSHNGKDSECSFAYDEKTLDERETGSFKCKGQGKGRCKITLTSAAFQDCGDQGRINVDHGDTLLVFRMMNGNIKQYAQVSADAANCCGDEISDSDCNVRYANCTAWDFSTSQCADYLECMVEGGDDDSCKAAAE